MIENASLGISAVDEKGSLIGYAAFFDYPALTPAVSPSHWPEWLHTHFGHDEYLASNAAWLSFLITDHLSESEVSTFSSQHSELLSWPRTTFTRVNASDSRPSIKPTLAVLT